LQARLRRVMGIAEQLLEPPVGDPAVVKSLAGDAENTAVTLRTSMPSSRHARPHSATPRTAATAKRSGTPNGLQAALRKHSLPPARKSFESVPDLEKALGKLEDTLNQLPSSAISPGSEQALRGKHRQRLPAAEAALASAMEQLNSSLASTAPQCSKQSTRQHGMGSDSRSVLLQPMLSRSPSELAPPRSWQPPMFTSPQPSSSSSSGQRLQDSQRAASLPVPRPETTPERRPPRSPWALSGGFVEKHSSSTGSTWARTPPDFSSCSSSSPDLSTLDKTWRGRLWSATQTEGVIEANSTLAAQVGGELAALAALASEARVMHPECAPLADALRAAVAEELALLRTRVANSDSELSTGVRLAEVSAFARAARDSLERSLMPVPLPSSSIFQNPHSHTSLTAPAMQRQDEAILPSTCTPGSLCSPTAPVLQQQEPLANEDWASFFALRSDKEAQPTPPSRFAQPGAQRPGSPLTPPREPRQRPEAPAAELSSRFVVTPNRQCSSQHGSPSSVEAKAMAQIFGSVADDMRSTIAEIRAARKERGSTTIYSTSS